MTCYFEAKNGERGRYPALRQIVRHKSITVLMGII
jgi:hypothetical protein